MSANLLRPAQLEERRLDPLERTRALVQALRSAHAYFHPVGDVQVIETHISHVVLAGPYAYKIKKPVKLHFLDFSTLQARRHYCEEEARLNAIIAPELYLGVVPIVGTLDRPLVGAAGEAIEYAVRMRRFPEAARFERLARSDRLEVRHVDDLAIEIARLHLEARRSADGLEFGSPDEVLRCALDNFRTIQTLEDAAVGTSIPRALHEWTLAEHARIRDALAERQRSGFVRECHGDLHLGNVVLLDSRPVLFDRIEFNAGFRWIDVMSDLAFIVMDLHAHGQPDFAARLLGEYLERTDDYAGLAVLRFYLVYRAMVRAKTACIRSHQEGLDEAERERVREKLAEYMRLAVGLAESAAPGIVLMHGVSGSGKTTVSRSLAEILGGVRLRSDVIRKRIHGYEAYAKTHSPFGKGLYGREATDRTYLKMAARAARIAQAGYLAIVDAASLESWQRRTFRKIAREQGIPFAIVDCVAPHDELRMRLVARERRGGDASEAGLAVLDAQLALRDPLDAVEREACVTCDTTKREHAADLADELRHLMLSPRRK